MTDFLDGYFARRRRQVTRLGKLLDPAADKILISAAFISLVELGLVPAWMVVTCGARVRGLGAAQRRRAGELVISARLSGKIKTTVQIVSIALLIIYNQLGEFRHLAPLSLWVAVVVTFFSGVEYFVKYGRMVVRAK